MRVEAACSGVSMPFALKNFHAVADNASAPLPMEIGNTQLRKLPRSKQRLEDIRNNACFNCHKPGWCPWMQCRSNGAVRTSVSNIEAALASEEHHTSVDSDGLEC